MSAQKEGSREGISSHRRHGPSDVDRPDSLREDDRLVAQEETLLVEAHMGPLPAPRTLAGYEEVTPGSAERIIVMAEKQQEHDHAMQRSAQAYGATTGKRGQIFGFVVALAGLGLGTYLLAIDKSLWGVAAAFGPFVGLVGLFIWGQWSEQRRRGGGGARPSAPPQVGDRRG